MKIKTIEIKVFNTTAFYFRSFLFSMLEFNKRHLFDFYYINKSPSEQKEAWVQFSMSHESALNTLKSGKYIRNTTFLR